MSRIILSYSIEFKAVISQTGLHDIVSAQVYSSERLPKYACRQTALLLSPTF